MSMSDDYTPTTERVREDYALLSTMQPFYDPEHDAEVQAGRVAFDRWLAAHDAALLAKRDEFEPEMASGDTWVQRTSPSTVVVRRGSRIVLALIDDGEVGRIALELMLTQAGRGD